MDDLFFYGGRGYGGGNVLKSLKSCFILRCRGEAAGMQNQSTSTVKNMFE